MLPPSPSICLSNSDTIYDATIYDTDSIGKAYFLKQSYYLIASFISIFFSHFFESFRIHVIGFWLDQHTHAATTGTSPWPLPCPHLRPWQNHLILFFWEKNRFLGFCVDFWHLGREYYVDTNANYFADYDAYVLKYRSMKRDPDDLFLQNSLRVRLYIREERFPSNKHTL